ncbi:MAG: hypothetical protein AAB876_02805, partial [Patescibacteria group bacterium]
HIFCHKKRRGKLAIAKNYRKLSSPCHDELEAFRSIYRLISNFIKVNEYFKLLHQNDNVIVNKMKMSYPHQG